MFNRVLIVSGPTREPIDPVRYLSNRSSGKFGFHIAGEAVARGVREVVFVTGPTRHFPDGVTLVRVETALEMREKVLEFAPEADVIVMAAAVSDYRVASYSPQKIKKDRDRLTLDLVKNPDILSELGRTKGPNQILVGFAAETEAVIENARGKLKRKKADILVLNEISTRNPAFGEEENEIHLLTRDGVESLPLMKKSQAARRIWDRIAEFAENRIPQG